VAAAESATGDKDELCAAIDEAEAAIDAIDPENLSQAQSQIDAVQTELDEARAIGGDEYAAEFDTMDAAIEQFQVQLNEVASGDLLGGLVGMAEPLADLAAAGEALDAQLECPGGTAEEQQLEQDLEQEEQQLEQDLEQEEQQLEQELEQELQR
jgi:exonuclease VII large subunit